jgi:hypothetical protein
MAGISVPFLSPSRCVLLITDDSLCVYDVTSRSATLLDQISWRSPEFENTVADLIRHQAGGKSVLILNDAVEQHYRKEKVPKITMFDRASLVQRRLSVAFPNYPIRAALELKDKGKKQPLISLSAPPKTDGQLYLFAAVPATDAFARTLEAINRSGVGIAGYSLLPVESADMVKKLAEALSKQKRVKDTAIWSVLIGQHHGGGLRQIVTKNGELALTRITPVKTPDETDVAGWCTDVAQEFQATLSYLSRFGYSVDDGLNVMVMANPDLGNQLESFIGADCNYFCTTTPQASHLLGVPLGRGTDNHYADPLHVAWSGRKAVALLPLKSRDLEKVGKPRKIATAAMLLLSCGFGYLGYQCSNEAVAMYAATKNIEIAKQQRIEIEAIYQAELKRKEEMGIDVNLIQGALSIYNKVENSKVDPLPLLKVVGRELKNLRIDGLEYINPPLPPVRPNEPPPPTEPVRDFSMVLKFSFAGTVLPQDGNAEMKELTDRLNAALPDYTVTVQKELVDLTYRGALTDETGLTATQRKADDRYEAEVLIKKKPKA